MTLTKNEDKIEVKIKHILKIILTRIRTKITPYLSVKYCKLMTYKQQQQKKKIIQKYYNLIKV